MFYMISLKYGSNILVHIFMLKPPFIALRYIFVITKIFFPLTLVEEA